MYKVIKTYTPEAGLSCAFRQWRATHSHCQLLHGYAIGVRFIFQATTLDERNWVYDFGGTKVIKDFLVAHFDHKTLVAIDDPYLPTFQDLAEKKIIDLIILEHVGCEKFAEFIFYSLKQTIESESYNRVNLRSVEVFEHGGNSAVFEGVK